VLGAGIWSHHPATPTPAEQEFANLSVLMYGIKAFNFYMLVERERWQGSPITRHAGYRPEFAPFYRDFLEFLRSYQFWNFQRRPRALVLLSYDLERFEAANSTLNFGYTDLYRLPSELFCDARDLGLRWDHLAGEWLSTLKTCLRTACIDYDLADTHLGLERMQRYPLVFLQSADFMDASDQRVVADYLAAGGDLVIGPGVPYLDAYLRPCDILAASGRFRQTSEAQLAKVVAELIPPGEFHVHDARIDLVPHFFADRQLLFVSNPTPDRVSTQLEFVGARRFGPAWGSGATRHAREGLDVQLEPCSIQVWEVEPAQ
jgi:beta-galactosidase